MDRNSVISFFVIGFALMIFPLALILLWNQLGCFSHSLGHSSVSYYCLPTGLNKNVESFLPFLMVIGGVLVGYNIKRISDSNLPPPEDSEDDEESGEGRVNGTDLIDYSVNTKLGDEKSK